MRNINKILIGAAFLGLAASCDVNQTPMFQEEDSFVYVDINSITVKEDAGVIKIPVKQASVQPYKATVAYQVKAGTAQEGIDYKLVDNSAVLNFDGEERETAIEIEIINRPGEYVKGGLAFSLELISVNKYNLGNSIACSIAIKDNDHPLAAVLGTYQPSGIDALSGDSAVWARSVRIVEDPDDDTVVKIKDLTTEGTAIADLVESAFGGAIFIDNTVYGIVSEDKKTITIPNGQAYKTNNPAVFGALVQGLGGISLMALTLSDDGFSPLDEDILLELQEDGSWKMNHLICDAAIFDGNFGGYFSVLEDVTLTKIN